jgi:5-methyltetrahydropteroyltriglutamate--homocysteine methyltransferase
MATKYRADHIGSLLRPAELLQARSAGSAGQQLRALEDKHILQVLRRQKDLGFKIFTDGELRRINFMSDFNEAVEGLDESDNLLRSWQAGSGSSSSRPSRVPRIVEDKVKQV